jgi:hypothetical protein
MTVPGGFSAGDILTAADMNDLPGGLVAYASRTSNQLISVAGPTDLTDLTVTFMAQANRYYKITGHVPITSVDVDERWLVELRAGSTTIGRIGQIDGTDSSNNDVAVFDASIIHTPSAGNITYKLRAERTAGTGDANFFASSDNPAYILVEDIGKV